MDSNKDIPKLFPNGAAWLRADFHLHTRADREFSYAGEENSFISDYVAGLKAAEIRIGVIANHNKFDQSEFKALQKKAGKEGICLLPGVELSVNDGAGGIHMLIVFSDRWLENGNDYLSPVIAAMFPGKAEPEYQHENGRSDKNILQVVDELGKSGRDYFIIFAHVEQSNGLWKEMEGGKLGDFKGDRYNEVRARTLGFQKVRTHDVPDRACRMKAQNWLSGWYPAEVEGSDCKSVEDIGKGKKCFLKVGALSFGSVKFALLDNKSPVSSESIGSSAPPSYRHSHIRAVRFTGGILSGKTLHFSPELNTLIGIRGSGKSAVLESLRYVLGIPFGENVQDKKYKEELIPFALKDGGTVEIDAVDCNGHLYTIRRRRNAMAEVLIDNLEHPGISIRETILRNPVYFGQKDLAATGEGFEQDLIDKIMGAALEDIRRKIDAQLTRVKEAVSRLAEAESDEEELDHQQQIKADTEHRLKIYAEHGVEERLQKRLDLDGDLRFMARGIEIVSDFLTDANVLMATHEDEIKNHAAYATRYQAELLETFRLEYGGVLDIIGRMKSDLDRFPQILENLTNQKARLLSVKKEMAEDFAEIERKLARELEQSGARNISAEEFLELKKKLDTANRLIVELQKKVDRRSSLEDELTVELEQLETLERQEFELIVKEAEQINSNESPLTISCGYKADKNTFRNHMKTVFKGSGTRETTYGKIAEHYDDFSAVYRDLKNARTHFGSNPEALTALFRDKLKTLFSRRTPHLFSISYNGKELSRHSLGQRASALILFVLTRKDTDLVIIDQPEDDLDNKTIFTDVIRQIRKMKPSVQFIFATHNPNIPVLGDAEQVHACDFVDNRVNTTTGSIDDPKIQSAVVNIMEGGREAFDRRREIYQAWTA